MKRPLSLVAAVLALLSSTALSTAQGSDRLPITPAVVASALALYGVNADASLLDVPSSLTSKAADLKLRVTATELLPGNRLRVRLACQQLSDCPPFLITFPTNSASEAASTLGSLQRSRQLALSARSGAPVQRLQAGQHTTLLLEDSYMRISLPVLAIDSGAPGSEVRVSSLDRKQLYHAVVTDLGTVHGSLQ